MTLKDKKERLRKGRKKIFLFLCLKEAVIRIPAQLKHTQLFLTVALKGGWSAYTVGLT